MNRIGGLAALAVTALAGCASIEGAFAPDSPEAVHRRLLTLDTHVDIPLNFATGAVDPGSLTASQVDLPKMRAGGLDAAFFIVYTPQGEATNAGYAAGRQVAEIKWRAIRRMTRLYPEQIALATTADEARRAVADGKLVAFIGMENAYPLGQSVADVALWAERGVTYVGPVHFGHNQFGDSANNADAGPPDPPVHDGLSPLGEQLVAELNAQGVMIDVSHAARTTMMDIVAASRAPVIASHSAVSALNENRRSLDDGQLRAIAANGGVAQIVAFASYLTPADPGRAPAIAALRARFGVASDAEALALADESAAGAYFAALAEIDAQYPRGSVSDFVDHIDHAVEVAGIDHVGVASDFDGGGGVVGWSDASETAAVTEELLRRGYSEEDLAKIWGGNLLRVLDEVQAIGWRIRGAILAD